MFRNKLTVKATKSMLLKKYGIVMLTVQVKGYKC